MPKYEGPYWVHSDPNAPVATEAPARGEACEGPCNHQWRKSIEAHATAWDKWLTAGMNGHEPQPPETEPWPGEPIYCRKCATRIRAALRELPLAYEALDGAKYLTRTAAADDERRGRADHAPSPSPGADLQDEIVHAARTWEDSLRRHLGHQAATDEFGDIPTTLTAAVEYLNRNFAEMIERDDERAGIDFGSGVSRMHRTALAMLKNKPVRKHLPTPCPSPGCGMKALIQEEGVAGKPWYVECSAHLGGCGRLYAEQDWEWFGRLLIDGHVQVAMVPVDA
jgi:hypothetical protein